MSDVHVMPDYWEDAKKHLSTSDPVMKKIIKCYKGETLKARGDAFYTLARSIVGQQISVKAADSVWNKLVRRSCEGRKPSSNAPGSNMDPSLRWDDDSLHRGDVERLTDEQLRECGLSAQKVKYLRAIAEYFESPPNFHGLDSDALLASLTNIKGVGVWTAEMFMIFHLLKPDVLPVGDIGLLKAIGLHYGDGKNKANKETALEVAKPWQPYRTVATWYLWRSLDPVVVEY